MIVGERSEVCAIFDDPRFEVPSAEPGSTGIGWLRASVSRFANGQVHARRRALVERLLDDLAPRELRSEAECAAHTIEERDVPLAVLCTRLGVDRTALPQAVTDARTVASAYPLDSPASEAADAAVARLVALLGPRADEATAARIALLAQAGAATGALIDAALERVRENPSLPVEQIVAETLTRTPPVATTRRVRDGRTHVLDLAAAQLPFGYGRRACPGREHALALVSGVMNAAARRVA
jgi:cytochrome P450